MDKIGYVTLEEANSYISSSFLSSDEKRKAWEGLSDDDKKVLLRQSLYDIESLNFYGKKTDPCQPYKFPRNGNNEVPDNVKFAQILGAILKLDTDSTYDLIEKGITSERVGNVSYTYSSNSNLNSNKCRPEVYKFLKMYIKGIQILNIR